MSRSIGRKRFWFQNSRKDITQNNATIKVNK